MLQVMLVCCPTTLLQSVTDLVFTVRVVRGTSYLFLRHEDNPFLFRAGIIIAVGKDLGGGAVPLLC